MPGNGLLRIILFIGTVAAADDVEDTHDDHEGLQAVVNALLSPDKARSPLVPTLVSSEDEALLQLYRAEREPTYHPHTGCYGGALSTNFCFASPKVLEDLIQPGTDVIIESGAFLGETTVAYSTREP